MKKFIVRVWFVPLDVTDHGSFISFYEADDIHHAMEQYLDDPYEDVEIYRIDIEEFDV